MSGGHYEYKYHVLHELADEIRHDIAEDGKPNEYELDGVWRYDPRILEIMKDLAAQTEHLAKHLRELEWFMSGDYGTDSYLAAHDKINEE
jgi:SAM-dependent MidA family methyltransferase